VSIDIVGVHAKGSTWNMISYGALLNAVGQSTKEISSLRGIDEPAVSASVGWNVM
jgi:hypothetical protein